MRKRHHVVSRGYQRLFANGEQLLLCEKVTREARAVGSADAFVRKHFSSYMLEDRRLDDLEDDWARLENMALPVIRRLLRGHQDSETMPMVKVLAAIHFTRSYGFDLMFGWVVSEHLAAAPAELAQKRALRRAFRMQYGRDAKPGEIETIVSERFDDLMRDNRFKIERMASGYNKTLEFLKPLHVQLLRTRPRSPEFVLGDTPFVHFDKSRLGLKDRLALGDAGHAFMPLGRNLAAMFTTRREQDELLPVITLQSLNWLVWRAAHRQVACHPENDLGRSLGTRIRRLE